MSGSFSTESCLEPRFAFKSAPQKAFSEPPTTTWRGRMVRCLVKGSSTAEKILSGVFLALRLHCLNPQAFASCCRKAERQIIPLMEWKNGRDLGELKAYLKSTANFIYAVQVADGLDYLAHARYRQDGRLVVAAKAILASTQFGETLLWFKEMGFLGPLKTASFMGRVMLLGDNLSGIIPRGWCLSYLLFAADAFNRLRLAENFVQKIQACLDGFHSLAEVGLGVMVLCHAGNIVVLGVMAVICVSLGAVSLLHRERYQNGL